MRRSPDIPPLLATGVATRSFGPGSTRRSRSTRLLLLALLAAAPPQAHAVCDVIPGPTNQFRAAVGAADRPFAGPGEFVDMKVRPEVCDRASAGVKDVASPSGIGPEDAVVTVVFTPPGSGARHAVVTATSCATLAQATCVGGLAPGTPCTGDLQCLPAGTCSGPSRLDSCQAQLGPGGSASCVAATGPDLLVSASASEARVRFRFPDTDALVGTASDDRTLAGPATLVASAPNQPLPCGVATQRCAETGGTIACVDELYAIDGTCATTAASLDETFPRFTALPPPNDYEAVCSTPGTPCDGTATEVRFTTDAGGNVLIPMDYRGVLVRLDDVPVPRLVRGETDVDAFAGGSVTPVSIPDPVNFLASYSPQGRRVPPLFTPLADPNAPASLTLFGSVDAPQGVIRIARKGPGTLTCSGGANAGNACTSDAQCPGADCALFEFRDRYDAGIGPVVLPDTLYAVNAESPVPIDGLNETTELFAFVRSEAIEGADLNGDGDQTDPVLTLRERTTGTLTPIGAGGAPGRASARIRQLPFAYPAVAAEGDLVAYLEPEPLQGDSDLNANGQVFESVLRVFRQGAGGAAELTVPGSPPTADTAPLVAGRSVALADGKIWFRTREAAEASRLTETIPASANEKILISAGGRCVVFTSVTSSLVPGDTNARADVFVVDRALGRTVRVNVSSGGAQASGTGTWAGMGAVSAGCRFVAFTDSAGNLVAGDTNGGYDGFVHDRDFDEDGIYDEAGAISTSRVTVTEAGAQCSVGSSSPAVVGMSDDGRFVVLRPACNLGAVGGLLRRDRDADLDGIFDEPGEMDTENAAFDDGGGPGTADGRGGFDVSPDARFVAYGSTMNQTSDDTNGMLEDLYMNDLETGRVIRISVDSEGFDPDGESFGPRMSADGRLVGFHSDASDLVAGDTNGFPDVFLRDVRAGANARLSVASDGAQANGSSSAPSLSRDGHLAAFASSATNLTSEALPGTFIHDVFSGQTVRIGAFLSNGPAISSEGGWVAFASFPILVNGPDPAAAAADRSGDAALDDTVLRVLDPTLGPPSPIVDLCPAGQVEIAAGRAAFLRPESAGVTSNAACSGPGLLGPDLNGDGDAGDDVVHLYAAGVVTNLRCAATAVAISATRVAALVSEAAAGGMDRNGDGDTGDHVVAVRSVAAGAPVSCADPGWVNLSYAADALSVVGDVVAFSVPEGAQGLDLNADGDALDRVLHLYDAGSATLTNVGRAAEEFVLGDALVAFRVPEAAQGGTSLNGDSDAYDHVLHVFRLATAELVNTGQTARACDLEACDPRVPYRVAGETVKFLTYETGSNVDLNGDGDEMDVVLQSFNAHAPQAAATQAVAPVLSGSCSDDGRLCFSDEDCPGAECFVPPGQCVVPLGVVCDPSNHLNPGCPSGAFCRGDGLAPDVGSCFEVTVACGSSLECGGGVCESVDEPAVSLVAPVPDALTTSGADDLVLASTGTCVETLAASCAIATDCEAGEFCAEGSCARAHGPCASDEQCAAGTCIKNLLITATAADIDGDGLADPIDNCPAWPNAAQADADADGTGDLCDAQTCGNGVREGDPTQTLGQIEECDDGDLMAGDGCDASCQREAQDCADGFDNDGDGVADMADPGCNLIQMASERPACSDGLDNDADGQIDHPADAQCQGLFDPNEGVHASTCGLLGPEPLVLYGLLVLARRRRSAVATSPRRHR